MKKPKLSDVACRAGVSLATASLALAGKGRISTEVREQVIAAAETLGYRQRRHPSTAARPATRCIGILHHHDKDYEWNFIRPILFNIETSLLQHNYTPVLIPVSAKLDVEAVFRQLVDTGVGAVFSIHFHDEQLFDRLEKRGTLVIIVNNSNLQNRFDSICVDDFQGAYEGCLHLLKLGHRNILYLEYARPDLPAVIADRFIGFRKALEENAIPFAADQRITVRFMDRKELTAKLKSAFARQRRPTAVFAHDDYLAAYIYAALQELGFKVPEQVSLIAPGDVLDYGEPYTPPITTMRINTSSLGILACRLLLDRLKGHIDDVHVLKLKQQLVKRGTCAKPAF